MSVPGPPNINLLPLASPNTLQYAWDTPAQPNGTISAYKLVLTTSGSNAYSNTSIVPTRRSYIVGPPEITLVNGVTYGATLQAINENGEGQSASFLDFQPGNSPTVSPSNVSVSAIGSNSALVQWAPPAQAVNSTIFWYTIYSRSSSSSDPVLSYTASGLTDRSYFITGLNPSSSYYFEINAVNCPGYSPSAYTSTISFTSSIISYDFFPTSISSLQFWLDAASITGLSCNAAVTTWTDKSSNTYVGTSVGNPTYITNSMNGNPIVRFNGVNQYVNYGDILDINLNSISMFAVAKYRTTANGALVGKSAFNALSGRYSFVRDSGTMLGVLAASNNPALTYADTSTTVQLTEMIWDRSSNTFYRNGAFQQGLSAIGSSNYNTDFLFYVGAYQNNVGLIPEPGYYFDGDMAEILLYYSPLGTYNREQIEGYLAWKWGFQTNLYLGHPFRYAKPYTSNYPFIPSMLGNLRMWLDPTDSNTYTTSGSSIVSWTDKSQYAYLFSNSDTGRRPTLSNINGSNAFSFVGPGVAGNTTSQFLSNATLTLGSYANYSIFAIGKQNASTPSFTGYNWLLNKDYYLYLGANANVYAGFTGNGTTLNDTNAFVPACNVQTPSIMEMITSSSSLTGYYNGVTLNTKTGTTGTFTGLNVGDIQPNGNSGQCWNGQIGDIIIYDTALSTSQRQLIEGYLAWKWGTQSTLPTGHPYKNAAPTTANLP
jgi:hypothetical protein